MKRAAAARNAPQSLSLVVHGDLLDPLCWLAERRVATAAEELCGWYGPLAWSSLPRSLDDACPTPSERRRHIRELRRAASEPDAPPLSPEPWNDAGRGCSTAAMVAVVAASFQGRAHAATLRGAVREAGLSAGLDVSRRDVLVELAARAGLDLARFLPALDSPASERLLRAEVAAAAELGVTRGPALVIAGEWLVAGLRALEDYRLLLRRYLETRVPHPAAQTVH